MKNEKIMTLLDDEMLETIDCIFVYHMQGEANLDLQKAYMELCEVFNKSADGYDMLDAETCRRIIAKNEPVDVVMAIRKLASAYEAYVSRLRAVCHDIFPQGGRAGVVVPIPDMDESVLADIMERSGLRWARTPDARHLCLLGTEHTPFPSNAGSVKAYVHELLRIPPEILENMQHGVHSLCEDMNACRVRPTA